MESYGGIGSYTCALCGHPILGAALRGPRGIVHPVCAARCDPDPRDAEIASLRERLATAERERDEARADLAHERSAREATEVRASCLVEALRGLRDRTMPVHTQACLESEANDDECICPWGCAATDGLVNSGSALAAHDAQVRREALREAEGLVTICRQYAGGYRDAKVRDAYVCGVSAAENVFRAILVAPDGAASDPQTRKDRP